FEDEQETPEEAAALVSLFSELLVGSIDGFATEMNVSKSFIGIILLPVVGNDVEHVTAIKAALNNKYTVLVPRLRKLHGFGAGANAGGGGRTLAVKLWVAPSETLRRAACACIVVLMVIRVAWGTWLIGKIFVQKRGSGLAGSRYQTMVKSAVAAPTKPL
ncbi:hypothetical protein PF005_g33253, partial [Phytophthora fragariae]